MVLYSYCMDLEARPMRALLWFKKDLRLDDHPALQAGLSAEYLLPVYVLEPRQLQANAFGMRRMGVHRARFLLESLAALDGELRQRGSPPPGPPGAAQAPGPPPVAARLGEGPLLQAPANNLLRREELPCDLAQLPTVFSRFRERVEERLQVFQPRQPPEHLPPLPDGAQALLQPIPSLSRPLHGETLHVPPRPLPFSRRPPPPPPL